MYVKVSKLSVLKTEIELRAASLPDPLRHLAVVSTAGKLALVCNSYFQQGWRSPTMHKWPDPEARGEESCCPNPSPVVPDSFS